MKQTLLPVLLVFLLTSLSSAAHAQKKEVPAFMIKSPGDTIPGFIPEQKTQMLFEEVKFRAEQEQEYTTYKPGEILGYGTAGSLFVTREMPEKENRKLLFLKVIVNGPVKLLYSKTAELGERYYVQKQNDATVPLHPELYMGTVVSLFSDCAALQLHKASSRDRYSYTITSLTELVSSYSNCLYPDQQSQQYFQKQKLVAKFGARVGVHASKMHVETNSTFYTYHTFDWEQGQNAAVFANISVAGKRLSLQPELQYTSRKAESSIDSPKDRNPTFNSIFKAEAQYLQVPVLLKYSFGSLKLQPFLNAGLSYTFTLSSQLSNTVTFSGKEPQVHKRSLGRRTVGYVVGSGIIYKINNKHAAVLELRYNKDRSNDNTENKVIKFDTFQLTAGLTL